MEKLKFVLTLEVFISLTEAMQQDVIDTALRILGLSGLVIIDDCVINSIEQLFYHLSKKGVVIP